MIRFSAVVLTLCLIVSCHLAMIPININISTIAITWIYLLNLSWRNSVKAEPGNVLCYYLNLNCSSACIAFQSSGQWFIDKCAGNREVVSYDPWKSRHRVQSVSSVCITGQFSHNVHNDLQYCWEYEMARESTGYQSSSYKAEKVKSLTRHTRGCPNKCCSRGLHIHPMCSRPMRVSKHLRAHFAFQNIFGLQALYYCSEELCIQI